jgi:hypothetical protein
MSTVTSDYFITIDTYTGNAQAGPYTLGHEARPRMEEDNQNPIFNSDHSEIAKEGVPCQQNTKPQDLAVLLILALISISRRLKPAIKHTEINVNDHL